MLENLHQRLKGYEEYIGDKNWLTGGKVSLIRCTRMFHVCFKFNLFLFFCLLYLILLNLHIGFNLSISWYAPCIVIQCPIVNILV